MDMKWKNLLNEKRPVILQKWLEAIMATYPTDSSGFLQKQKDQFLNPVGHTFSQGINGIVEAMVNDEEFAEGFPLIDDIIRVRAIQEFTPDQALSFVFSLKNVVRGELEAQIKEYQLYDELLKFEAQVDALALYAFSTYVRCREQLFELRTDELKRMTYSLLKKANLMSELPDEVPEDKERDLIKLETDKG